MLPETSCINFLHTRLSILNPHRAVSPGVYTTVSGAKRLCVTNLAYDATIMTVVIEFHKFGTVAEVCVPMNR